LTITLLRSLLLQCHRRNEEGTDVVFPVNSIAYHPLYGTFATGGGDGVVNIWDGSNKKRLFQVRAFKPHRRADDGAVVRAQIPGHVLPCMLQSLARVKQLTAGISTRRRHHGCFERQRNVGLK
jgi:WD40 repeat protein